MDRIWVAVLAAWMCGEAAVAQNAPPPPQVSEIRVSTDEALWFVGGNGSQSNFVTAPERLGSGRTEIWLWGFYRPGHLRNHDTQANLLHVDCQTRQYQAIRSDLFVGARFLGGVWTNRPDATPAPRSGLGLAVRAACGGLTTPPIAQNPDEARRQADVLQAAAARAQ
ncbi:hypothetical protein ACO2Q1_10760 [Brevundimonas sp. VNH65]|uniref:hypothetical protein n=1 Tax=Brevundimonas sp. VNH65 TaxID=3400917 RepID=UPI003C128F24